MAREATSSSSIAYHIRTCTATLICAAATFIASCGPFAQPATAAVTVASGEVKGAFVFTNDYDDRLHPLCRRHIEVEQVALSPEAATSTKMKSRLPFAKKGQPQGGVRYVARFSGTDVGPKGIGEKVFLSCEPANVEKYKLREWSFDGVISPDGYDTQPLTWKIDAGDKIHLGTWVESISLKDSEPRSGIRWQDGNVWTIQDPVAKGSDLPVDYVKPDVQDAKDVQDPVPN